MLKNKNIICISSIDWDFIWQGHQEIMSAFAKNGNKVLFIENTGVRVPGIRDIPRLRNRIRNWLRGVKGIRQEGDNLYIFSPLVLPFPYSRLARAINRRLLLPIIERWMRVMDFNNSIVWTFLPTPLSLDIAQNLNRALFVYYCIDNFSVSSAAAKKIKRYEEKLLTAVDMVFVTSQALKDYCSSYNENVHLFPFAVNYEEFEKARTADSRPPEDLKAIKRPVIGYVGGVHKWIDQKLVREAAQKFPDCSFVFVGPVQTDTSILNGLPNVHFLGNKPHKELPSFIREFEVCLIPYCLGEYTKNVYPTKLNEYLAMGKAVVSTMLPEIIAFNKRYQNIVEVPGGEADFTGCIKRALGGNNEFLTERRIRAAQENSWGARIAKMSELIESEIQKKKLDRQARWKENLLVFYKRARRKIINVSLILILTYAAFFKTPLLWFLASPLRMSQDPAPADAIVVFGGGVGETGSPGKSTIERARYATELYKKGYSRKILFSSGYTYDHNDAEDMRLFALSMGVSPEDIILEQKANSAYENVRFSKEIADRFGWKTILLVSSPYNMRRVQLVFSRFGGGLKVIYRPVERTQFYDRAFGIRLRHIEAIWHEYMGIVYYWFKGYI